MCNLIYGGMFIGFVLVLGPGLGLGLGLGVRVRENCNYLK